ncbi:MAG: hypothetical protein J6A45_06510, partial [Lachnospiraceae bacterium]|nr:hypothetical protein [Lachnospiraceae bacterium]
FGCHFIMGKYKKIIKYIDKMLRLLKNEVNGKEYDVGFMYIIYRKIGDWKNGKVFWDRWLSWRG